MKTRFPYPKFVECDSNGSQARYVYAVLDPAETHINQSQVEMDFYFFHCFLICLLSYLLTYFLSFVFAVFLSFVFACFLSLGIFSDSHT
jgi:hypothetical protein